MLQKLIEALRAAGEEGLNPDDFIALGIPPEGTKERATLCIVLMAFPDGNLTLSLEGINVLKETAALFA